MKNKILTVVFLVWVSIWLAFLLRELFVKSNFRDYKILLSRSLDGKRSYVTGDNFYELLMFCKKNIPIGATYALETTGENFDPSLYGRRAAYYLYPDTEAKAADFIIIYGEPDAKRDGYRVFAKLDVKRYILRKEKK